MRITFYGVRGSTASPGPDTQKYGGNTSCVHIELEIGKHLILDAGTGIRKLGQVLALKDDPIFILLSHATGITSRGTLSSPPSTSPTVASGS